MGHASLISGGALQETIDSLLGTIGMEASRSFVADRWNIEFSAPRTDLLVGQVVKNIEARHTNRFPFTSISVRDLKTLRDLGDSNQQVRVVTDRTAIREIGRAVRLCSEARFNSQKLHEWLFSSIRWTAAEARLGDGLDVATLNLPPGALHFMKFISPWRRMRALNRVGIYKLLALVDSQPVSSAPLLIGVVGPATASGAWNAGRLMQRLWVRINAMHLAVHPYYVVTDLAGRLPSLVGRNSRAEAVAVADQITRHSFHVESDDQLHMLLRIGSPTCEPVRSRRKAPQAFAQSH